jgi:flagellar biosynthesis protein FlhA
MDMYSALERYLHRHVAIVTADRMRLQGVLSSVSDACVRLVRVSSSDAIESTGWYERLQYDDEEKSGTARWPEVVIQLHYVCAVTCLEDDILDVPFEIEPVADTQPEIVVETRPEDYLPIDPLTLLIGPGLIRLATAEQGDNLIKRLTDCRHRIAEQVGMLLPAVRVKDDYSLPMNSYQLLFNGSSVFRGEAFPDKVLAFPSLPGSILSEIKAITPFGDATGYWIDPSERDDALNQGCSVVEPAAAISLSFMSLVRRSLAELLTYNVVQQLLNACRRTNDVTVDSLVPHVISLPTLHEQLRRLLAEQVPIKNLALILESLGRHRQNSPTDDELQARLRVDLNRVICGGLLNEQQQIDLIGLDPGLTDETINALAQRNHLFLAQLAQAVLVTMQQQSDLGIKKCALFAPQQIRSELRKCFASTLPELTVICLEEVPGEVQVTLRAMLSMADLKSRGRLVEPREVRAVTRRRKPK